MGKYFILNTVVLYVLLPEIILLIVKIIALD